MSKQASLIGPNLYMDSRGVHFTKISGEWKRITNKYTEAEDRYVANQLKKRGEIK